MTKLPFLKLALLTLLSFTSIAQETEPYFYDGSFKADNVESAKPFQEKSILNSDSVVDNFSNSAQNTKTLSLSVDRYFSPESGGKAMISVMRGYALLDDAYIPSGEGNQNGWMIAGRVGKWILEGVLADYLMVAQHEVFGHGFRLRELHVPIHRYHVTPWGGAVYFGAARFNQLSLHEKIAIDVGGMEGNSILARRLQIDWLDSQKIDSREANLYIASALDQTNYVLSTRARDKTFANNGHDVLAYINDVNRWHQKQVLSVKKLRKNILVDFFDPYLFYSAYSFGKYVVNGEQIWEYPMINIKEYQYLPALRGVLSPFGFEYQLTNYVKGPFNNYIVTLRAGNTNGKRSKALGIEMTNLFTSDLLFLDGKLDLLHQPKLFTVNALNNKNQFGGAASLIGRYKLWKQLEVVGQVGYKTNGFIQGEVLRHSPILRAGFNLNL